MKKRWNFKGKGTYKKTKYLIMLFMLIPILLLNIALITNYSEHLNSELKQKREFAFLQITENAKKQFTDIQRIQGFISRENVLEEFLTDYGGIFVEDKVRATDTKKILYDTVMGLYNSGEYYRELEIYSYLHDCAVVCKGDGAKVQFISGGEWSKEDDVIYDAEEYIAVKKPLYKNGTVAGTLLLRYNKQEFENVLDIDKYDCDVSVGLKSKNGDTVLKAGNVNAADSRTAEIYIASADLVVEFGEGDNAAIAENVTKYSIVSLCLSVAIAYISATICTYLVCKKDHNGQEA